MSQEIPQIVTGHTELLGLIAYPIRHSSSPRMHNLALARLGLDYVYLAFEVDDRELKGAIDGMKALKALGWNVSMPNKVEVVKHLDKISPAVELCGACNTVVNDAGVLTGHNTDGLGYILALRQVGMDIAGRRLVLIGAGGAAVAITTQAALDGAAAIDIFNQRDAFFPQAEAHAGRISARTGCPIAVHDLADTGNFRAVVARADILGNASKIGFKGELESLSPLPDSSVLRADLFVSDVVYAPLKTRLLREAEAAGCRTMGGIPMMLHQGAAAFKMWTGKDMPLDYVEEHLFS